MLCIVKSTSEIRVEIKCKLGSRASTIWNILILEDYLLQIYPQRIQKYLKAGLTVVMLFTDALQ